MFPRTAHNYCALLVAMCVACIVAKNACAQEQSSPTSQVDADRVVLLKSGRLIEGTVMQTASGYEITRPNGSMLIPRDNVRFAAKSPHAAYLRMRAETPAIQANDHVDLCRWCMRNELMGEAITELRAATAMEPEREDLQRMLSHLQELVAKDDSSGPAPVQRDTSAYDPNVLLPAEHTYSLGGLPPELAAEYARGIQPLLINSCAQASCHGQRAESNFQLYRASIRSMQRHRQSDENLTAIISYINREQPEASELMRFITTAHGGMRNPPLAGAKSFEHIKRIRHWVSAVADHLPPETVSITLTSFEEPAKEEATPASKPSRTKSLVLDALNETTSPDPFSPHEFNRRYHEGSQP
ncbi:hypothetical protein [Calycomorphotria hydatis]|nr:hypothetical protein [Calycomorphotria hydatis]